MRKEKYRMSFKESAMIKFKANSLHILLNIYRSKDNSV